MLDQVIIPKNITVHLGKPAASARNVTVSFRKYIANVASSEVYPTWPEQAPSGQHPRPDQPGLNRIYTEWYPSKGYRFNITNSTSYDQYFVYGRTIFDVMERITDDIFNTYVRRSGTIEPYYTEYCDGKTVTCPGMKQWGTVTLANQGRSALQILRNYYGSSVEIVRTQNIQSIPPATPAAPAPGRQRHLRGHHPAPAEPHRQGLSLLRHRLGRRQLRRFHRNAGQALPKAVQPDSGRGHWAGNVV